MHSNTFLKIVIPFAISLIILGITAHANDMTDYDGLLDEYSNLYGEVFDDFTSSSDENLFLSMSGNFTPSELLKELNKGNLPLDGSKLLRGLLKLMFGEVYSGAKLMAIILATSLLSSYLGGFGTEFADGSISKTVFYVCYIVIAGTSAAAFYEIAEYTSNSIENIASFIKIFVPAVITILYTSGAVISASYLEPAVLGIIGIAVPVMQSVFIPAIMISAGLNVVNGISDKFKTDKLIRLINSAVKWGMSLMLTIFVSLAGLKSIASSGADGLSVKVSKFAASNLVPIVGGILSESVETVMNCSVLIKNSVGILGIIFLVFISLTPILKLGAMLIIFRITAAICEPVSNPKTVACLSGIADSTAVLFSILVAVTVMFIIIITILINAGNGATVFGG